MFRYIHGGNCLIMAKNAFDNNSSSLHSVIPPVFPDLFLDMHVFAPSINAKSDKDSLYSLNSSFVQLHSQDFVCNTAPVPFPRH